MVLTNGDANGARGLVFDWNNIDPKDLVIPKKFSLFDETLRDGLQNPSAVNPTLEKKIAVLHSMEKIGIHEADLGMPGSSQQAFDDVVRLCEEVVRSKMRIRVACAGRTVPSDITPIVEISQRVGIPIEVYAFIGSSPIRQYAENWDLSFIAKQSAESIDIAVNEGLCVAYVTEDTTRSRPDALTTLFRSAIDHGATRLCLSDTVGHATPDGVRSLVTFTKRVIQESGAEGIGIDWHGHNDRGLALVNTLWALAHGADRIHGTALGIGERVGNAPMELLLLNLKLLGVLEHQDLSQLVNYCSIIAEAFQWDIPINYPLVGRDAFRTGTGVHAAAIIKALAKHEDAWLADCIYSGVPASKFGRSQEIGIGFMSGASNVLFWLRQRDIPVTNDLVDQILAVAKSTHQMLTNDEINSIVKRSTPSVAP